MDFDRFCKGLKIHFAKSEMVGIHISEEEGEGESEKRARGEKIFTERGAHLLNRS
jgi:hypothetical protein